MDHIDITRKELTRAGIDGGCTCEICAAIRKTLEDAEKYNAMLWGETFRDTRACAKECPGYNEQCGTACRDVWERREYWLEKWRARSGE